ncbi:MAG: hypothetical protein RIR16_253 [Actinomycetota bacterium]
MDGILWLLLGLVIGASLGYLFSKAKAPRTQSAQIDLAAALARSAELQNQIDQLQRERTERDERDREENRLLQVLTPVKAQIEQMQHTVARLEKDRVEQFGTIQQQLKNAVESDEALRKQTQALASALSSNSLRGVWGETQLRKLVELAGLLKHADFDEQSSITTNAGAGRADMVINLPGGKALAIDSKVPFSAYQEAAAISELASPEELARRAKLLDEHVRAVKNHVDALGSKAYWTGLNNSPDFVIAFVPSESLLSAALDADPTLLEYAFKKNVAVASPVSLFSVLKTINYIWRQNADENSVRSMIKIGRELYERVGVVANHADKLGRSLLGTVKDYNQFVSSLETRLLVSARKLNDLDESQLAVDEIPAPKSIEATPTSISAAEAIESKDDKNG